MAIYLNLKNNRCKGFVEFTSTNTFDEFNSSNVKTVLLKRKIDGKNGGWFTIYTKPISIDADLLIKGKDIYVGAGHTYLYELEYYDTDNNLLTTISNTVECKFDCVVLCDKENYYYTELETGSADTNTIKPFALNSPLNSRKPSFFYNSIINYEEGNCEGIWLDTDGSELLFKNNYLYRRQFKNWLTNGKAKVLKNFLGETWLIGVKTDTISDKSFISNKQVEGARKISFDWAECGEINSESDMYDLGLIDIESTYWSGV